MKYGYEDADIIDIDPNAAQPIKDIAGNTTTSSMLFLDHERFEEQGMECNERFSQLFVLRICGRGFGWNGLLQSI